MLIRDQLVQAKTLIQLWIGAFMERSHATGEGPIVIVDVAFCWFIAMHCMRS